MTGIFLYLSLLISQNHCDYISRTMNKTAYQNCVKTAYECLKQTNIQAPKLECLK